MPSFLSAHGVSSLRNAEAVIKRRLPVQLFGSLPRATAALALALALALGPTSSRAVECSNGGVGTNPAGNDGGSSDNTACGSNCVYRKSDSAILMVKAAENWV